MRLPAHHFVTHGVVVAEAKTATRLKWYLRTAHWYAAISTLMAGVHRVKTPVLVTRTRAQGLLVASRCRATVTGPSLSLKATVRRRDGRASANEQCIKKGEKHGSSMCSRKRESTGSEARNRRTCCESSSKAESSRTPHPDPFARPWPKCASPARRKCLKSARSLRHVTCSVPGEHAYDKSSHGAGVAQSSLGCCVQRPHR